MTVLNNVIENNDFENDELIKIKNNIRIVQSDKNQNDDKQQPNTNNTTPTIKSRTVLWYLVFVGFAINYMIRINMNITIVDMIKIEKSMNQSFLNNNNYNNSKPKRFVSECYNNSFVHEEQQQSENTINKFNFTKETYLYEHIILDFFNIPYDKDGFNWNEHEQGLVLGSFFWLHWLTQIPGGILARKYGTKLIFGGSNVIASILCFVMPMVAYLDIKMLIFLRVVQGLIAGLAWPSMHNMAAQWIPPNERSKFVTAYLGSSFGLALFYPLFGFVISYSTWEWVYHLCGIIGIIWYTAWCYFVYDTPAKHPRIDPNERLYIEKSLGKTFQVKLMAPTPWKKILTSKPVWMVIIAQWGGIWGLFTLMTQAPTYFKIIHGWNMQMTGILAGLPHLTRMLFALVFSFFGDYLIKSDKMSTTNVRKFAGGMCCLVKGILVLALAYSGCNSLVAVIFLTLATTFHGAVSTGPLANMVDLSPNYSSIVLGISGMITVLPGFISPIIVGRLTLNNQTIQQWQYVFFIAAFQLIVSGILYILFTDSNLQEWNSPTKIIPDTKNVEMNNFENNLLLKKEDDNQQVEKQNVDILTIKITNDENDKVKNEF